MNKRIQISKKIRFEVFKRDSFICQYCGDTPPKVILEIDHLEPVSKGGSNNINNLITSCFDCNRGKTNIPLDRIPAPIAENLEILKEKELQLKEYNKLVRNIESIISRQISGVSKIFQETFVNNEITERFKRVSIKQFINKLDYEKVKDAMAIACSKIPHNSEQSLRYFCGICWRQIKGD